MPLVTRCNPNHNKPLHNDIQPNSVNTQTTTYADTSNPIKDINGTKHKVTAINQQKFLTDSGEDSLVAKHFLFPLTRVIKTTEAIKTSKHVQPSAKHQKTALDICDILTNPPRKRWYEFFDLTAYFRDTRLNPTTTSQNTFCNPRITSTAVFWNYIKLLDPHRLYFTKDDIEFFQQHEDTFLTYIQTGNLRLGFEMFYLVMDRKLHKIALLLLELEKGIDNNKLTTNEIIDFDRKEAPWLEKSEQTEYWLNYLYKDIMLLQLYGYDNTEIVNKLIKKYTKESLETVAYQTDDTFEYLINSVARLEYRTLYRSPKSHEHFQEFRHAAHFGAGFNTKKHPYGFMITKIDPNSPAANSESLKENQVIKSIAFNNSKNFNDATKMQNLGLCDAYLQGHKTVQCEVIADILEPNKTFICDLALENMALTEQRPSSEMIETFHAPSNTKYKIGVIKIPIFYHSSTEAENLNGVAEDVVTLMNNLDFSETSAGLIIDLRNNPGGSFKEYNKLIAIFIERYYAYNARCIGEKKLDSILYKNNCYPKTTYNKPIICLVNSLSCSASEQFARAVQVYQRGLVVGERTIGKCVATSEIDVGYGTLSKITFVAYDSMGKSLNLIGVKPDIFITNMKSSEVRSEALIPHSKTYDDITVSEKLTVKKFPVALLDELNDQSYARKKDNPIFTYIEQINEFKQSIPDTLQIPLNKDLMQQQKQQRDTEELSIVNQLLQNTNRPMVASLKEANELYDFEKEASRSVLMEAAHILTDELASSHKHES
jgi:carboxyl-terminal processing protease